MATPTLFDRIGGQEAIMAAVDLFYQKVIDDPLTAPFFASLDLPAQIRKQVAFMATAFGGPAEYRGRDLGAAHARLVHQMGLGDAHFDAVARHLQATLRELAIDEALVAEVMSIVGSTRAQVLGR